MDNYGRIGLNQYPTKVNHTVAFRPHCQRVEVSPDTGSTYTPLLPTMSQPFGHPSSKRVAVVGSGCSGIAALWALKDTDHDVYLYEADGRLGGHTNTVQWRAGKYSAAVDTGFIVLNTATYRE